MSGASHGASSSKSEGGKGGAGFGVLAFAITALVLSSFGIGNLTMIGQHIGEKTTSWMTGEPTLAKPFSIDGGRQKVAFFVPNDADIYINVTGVVALSMSTYCNLETWLHGATADYSDAEVLGIVRIISPPEGTKIRVQSHCLEQ
jgi:hypothetical protein